MASIGLRYCVYAPLTENDTAGTFSYGTGKRGRKYIKADVKINVAKNPLYSDDALAENAVEFIDGDITINKDDLTNALRKDWLGNTTQSINVGGETVDELTANDTDTPPFIGLGYIQSKVIDNVRQYRAVLLTKVQFSEPDEAAETKGQNITWQTPNIVGKIFRRIDGAWKKEITTPSLATAIAWLSAKLNLAPEVALKSLIVGALELNPAFNPTELSYEVETDNDSDIVVAMPLDPEATVTIDLNDGTPVTNGQAAIWAEGENTLEITVTKGTTSRVYTVTVTKTE